MAWRLGSRSRTSTVSLADRAREAGDWLGAAQLYRAALDRNPRNPPIWVQYGHALKEAGDVQQAESAYRAAIACDPGCADAHIHLGHALKLQHRTNEAETSYIRAFALDRTLADPLDELRGLGWSEREVAEFARQGRSESTLTTSAEPEAEKDRGRLFRLLSEESGEDLARRISGYFDMIDGLLAARRSGGASRQRLLDPAIRRMRLLAERANTPQPVEASIVVPAFNQAEYTVAAITSVLEHASNTRFEIIIGNDASSDETEAVFSGLGGAVRCITHPENRGFIRNCNLCARHAAGAYIVLLNNDTLVLDNWLDELLAPFQRFDRVGLVGSKLLNADGTLQEAGGIVWRDGTGWNFGRGRDPRLPEFNYVKEVDYASGAAIAVPKALWDAVGGFDERYSPAYFDDSDLAFALRSLNLRVLYSPGAQLVHHEGISNGTDIEAGVKAYQAANRAKFVEKWRAALEAQHEDGRAAFLARDRSGGRKHILVIDHYVPQFDRDAGSRTIFSYLKMFADAGLQVTFWPDNLQRDREYAKLLQDIGIEVLYGEQLAGRFPEWIDRNGACLDYALFSRAHIARDYIAVVRERTQAKRLYYGHDLHAARLQREYAATGRQQLLDEIEFWRQAEFDVWQQADVVYYPAQDEADAVRRELPGKAARVLTPYVYTEREISTARTRVEENSAAARTILFVGGFRHRPNIDAAIWLVRDILPTLRSLIPGISTIVAGAFAPPEVRALAGEDVLVTDWVSEPMLEWLYRSAAVAVAPLRFGAGVKGKVVEALRYGVPVVTTIPGIQGLPGAEDIVEIAGTAEEFAEAIARLIKDPELARRRALQGLDFIDREFGYAAAAGRLAVDIPELAALADGKGLLRR